MLKQMKGANYYNVGTIELKQVKKFIKYVNDLQSCGNINWWCHVQDFVSSFP